MTQIAKDQEMIVTLTKIELSTIIKMNASCTKCAIMKRQWIKLAKISMNIKPATLLTPDAYGGYPEVLLFVSGEVF